MRMVERFKASKDLYMTESTPQADGAPAPQKNSKTRSSWWFALVSTLTSVVVLRIALPFNSPTAISYVQLPGVIIAVIAAIVCVVCFIRSPRLPIAPKLIMGILCVPTLFCALDFTAYYWLHVSIFD